MPDTRPPHPVVRSSRGLRAGIVLVAIFWAAAIPLIVTQDRRGRAAYDQATYYGATVRQFLRQWPRPDLSNYPAATTPGYYLLIAAAGRVSGTGSRTLQLIGSLFVVGLLATLAAAVGRRANLVTTLALCLPVLCSPYVFPAGVWLLPDVAGWWFALCVLLIALRRRVDGWTFILGSAAMLALVLVRQSHLWAAAPLCMAAWLGEESEVRATGADAGGKGRAWRLLLMCAVLLPALITLVYFVQLWGGMVPPSQQGLVSGGNSAAPAMVLTTAGALGVFYAPLIWGRLRELQWTLPALLGAATGAVAGLLPTTTFSKPAGRFSGLWVAAQYTPTFAGRSLIILLLAVWGGIVVALWLAALPPRRRWIWASALIAFIAMQATAHFAFQRYSEPLVLVAAALSVSHISSQSPSRRALLGPLLLAAVLAGVTVATLVWPRE